MRVLNRSISSTIRKHPSESVQALISAVLAEQDTYIIPDDPDVVRKMLLDLCHCIRGLERQLSRWRRTVQEISAENPASQDTGSESDSSDNVAGDPLIPGFSLYDPALPSRHFGKSSNLVMLRTAVDIRRELMGDHVMQISEKRPEFWSIYPWQSEHLFQRPQLNFPEDVLFRSLLDLYFVHVHPFVPLLHRPTFERAISDGLHLQDYEFGTVVLCVCAIASRYSNDPRNFIEGTNNPHSLGWPWFQQVANTQTTLVETPSLYKLQYCFLSSLFVLGTSVFHSSWAKVGLGIRLGQEMGVHRKHKGPRTVQNELWRRAYWLLLALDVMSGVNFGRPRATTGDDFDLELPAECDDEYWENEDPSQAFVQPPGVPSKLSFFIHYAKLLAIAGFAHRMLYSPTKMYIFKRIVAVGPGFDQKVVTEVNAALNQWMSALPDHLRWDPNREDGLFHRQSAVLHCLYYWTQMQTMQLHKQFIPRPNESAVLMFPSLAICTNAARCCVRIFEAMEGTELFIAPHMTAPVYVAATILLLSIWRNKRLTVEADVSKDLQDARRCMRVIGEYEKLYQLSGRLKDALSSIVAMVDMYLDGRGASESVGEGLGLPPGTERSSVSSSGSGSVTPDIATLRPRNADRNVAPPPFVPNIPGVSPAPDSSFYNPNVPPNIPPNPPNLNFEYSSSLNSDPHMAVHPAAPPGPMFPQNITVTPPSIGAAIPEEEWSSFMANVDVLLQSVDQRGFAPRY
ncbi:hypothetical protein GYMLUDRAFT_237846 [Collybiopsis luxurians FD-317 M1]|nr:hypothetical protein GYMLUDRAFT_237846 [Collybiopsis luxurians FD-317 M1]